MRCQRCWSILICFLAMVSMPVTAGVAGETGDSTSPLVELDGSFLTVRANGVPIETILLEIASLGGIEIFLQGRLNHTVTADLERTTLEKGIKRLIQNQNHAFTYGYDDHDAIIITELHIYSQSGQKDIKRISPGKITRPAQPTHELPDSGIVIHPPAPTGGNPLVSMEAIDPLMKINTAQAPYLPKGFHNSENRSGSEAWGPPPPIKTGAPSAGPSN